MNIALIDVDGTLVDSNYHHALAWQRAFKESDVIVPAWKIHRHVGMGGDQFVPTILGEDLAADIGEKVADRHGELFKEVIDEVVPLPGAKDLIVALKGAGLTVVLASSTEEEEVDHYIDLIGIKDLIDGRTTSADVDATKPEPDIIVAARSIAGPGDAFLIGDSPWDCEAAKRGGVPTVGVLTGGFARSELEGAGANVVYEDLPELADHLNELLTRL